MQPSFDPALNNRAQMKANPYMAAPALLLGKVVALHPEAGTVDLMIDGANGQGGHLQHVPVLSWSMGTQTGTSYFPTVDLAAPIPSPHGTFDQPLPSGKQDVWAVVGSLNGRANRPVVLGFMNPLQQQTRSNTVGDEVSVHESGIYHVKTVDGTLQIGLPDGSEIVINTTGTPVDMTSKNASWRPKTTTSAYQISITVKGPVVVDAPEVYLGTTQGNGAAVARVGDTVSVNTTTGAGTITSGSSKVFSG